MRHGAEDGDAEELVGEHRGSAGKARDVARARGKQAGLGAVRTAQAEIDETLARRGKHHAGGLGGDHGLELQEIDYPRFDELGLGQRGRHAQDRLVGEEHRTFRHGVDVAGKAQAGEIIDEVFAEPSGAREPIKLFGSKPQMAKKLEHLFEPGRNQKAALAGKLAHEEFKARGLGLATIQIGLHHVELVEIGQQCACRRVHAATFTHRACRARKARGPSRSPGERTRFLF